MLFNLISKGQVEQHFPSYALFIFLRMQGFKLIVKILTVVIYLTFKDFLMLDHSESSFVLPNIFWYSR